MPKKLTIEDAQQVAAKRGGKCLSMDYIGSHIKMSWECESGHQWQATLADIRRGHWCSDCRKRNIVWCHKLAKEKGGECLSENYVDYYTPIIWKCSNEHTWNKSLFRVQAGFWCPECRSQNKINLCNELAKKRNGRCLSKEYINSTEYMLWECSNGHQWEASFHTINSGKWCPGCRKKDLTWCQKLASEKGGKCLSSKYVNTNSPMLWECSSGHQWNAISESINQGSWCAICSGVAKKNIEWCHKLADKKDGKCLSAKYITGKEPMLWECNKGHQWTTSSSNINSGSWCPVCSGNYKRDIEWCHNLAKKKDGECLSTEYKNNQTRMDWKCSKGHVWSATSGSINQGSWCPVCGGHQKKDIGWCQSLAKEKGGKCLSSEYINSKTPMVWECENGHTWNAPIDYINGGSWCPACCSNQKKDIEWCINLANAKGGKCLSTEYKHAHAHLVWECSKGHQWSAAPSKIKFGRWCPTCGRLDTVRKSSMGYTINHWKTNEELVCQGTWEKKVVEHLNKNKVEFLWQDKTFTMPTGKTYRPDLFICSQNLWVEIKGYFWDDAKEKWDWFHEEYKNSELWNKEKLKSMKIL